MVDKMKRSNYENIMKYLYVFPDRTIISSGDFFDFDKKEFSFIDIDFLNKLFWCKDLLLEVIVYISPFYLLTEIEEGVAGYENCIIEQLDLPCENKKKIAELDDCGFGTYQDNKVLNKIYLNMPWLENACVSDYIDIVDRNKLEFDLYNGCLSNISDMTEGTDDFIQKYLDDYKDASINFTNCFRKNSQNLRQKV